MRVYRLFSFLNYYGRHALGLLELLERVDRRVDDIDRVGRAQRLRQDVVDAGAVHDGAHRAAGDDAGAGGGGPQQDDSGGVLTLDQVRDGAADHGDVEEVLLGDLDGLGDGGGDLLRLAVGHAHGALAVADDDQRREGEATAALDDLGHAVDGDDALDVLVLVAAVATVAAVTAVAAAAALAPALVGGADRAVGRRGPVLLRCSHCSSAFSSSGSEPQSALAGALGDGRDTAVVLVAAAVEHDCLDAQRLGAFGDELADLVV